MNIKATIFRNLFIKLLTLFCLFFVAGNVLAVKAGGGTTLYFDPNTASLTKGSDLTATVKITTNDSFGADVTVVFSSNELDVKSVENGGFYERFTYAQSDGKLALHGFMSTLLTPASGDGAFAKITFTTKKDSGTGAVSFLCDSNGETQVYSTSGENLLNCSNIGNQLNLTYTGSSNNNDDNNGYPPGYTTPNQCGGTCGSNYNCEAPLFCYDGFCRNTECRDDLLCTCKSTPTPAPTKKATPKPAPKGGATPEVVVLAQYTPLPLATPVPSPSPEQAATTPAGIDLKKVGLIAGGVILVLAIILLLLSRGRKPKVPKIIQPGSGNGPSTPPPTPFNPPPPVNPPV